MKEVLVHKFSVIFLLSSGLHLCVRGEGGGNMQTQDEFYLCRNCKIMGEMKEFQQLLDLWPCNMCKDGMKVNPVTMDLDKIFKESVPNFHDHHYEKEKSTTTNRENDQHQNRYKEYEAGRRTMLFVKILIGTALIVVAFVICFCKQKRTKKPTTRNTPEGAVEDPAANYRLQPCLPKGHENTYPLNAPFPQAGAPFFQPGVPCPPPPGFAYLPPETPHPPPYTPYPSSQAFSSPSQAPESSQLAPGLFSHPSYPLSDSSHTPSHIPYPLPEGQSAASQFPYPPPEYTSYATHSRNPSPQPSTWLEQSQRVLQRSPESDQSSGHLHPQRAPSSLVTDREETLSDKYGTT